MRSFSLGAVATITPTEVGAYAFVSGRDAFAVLQLTVGGGQMFTVLSTLLVFVDQIKRSRFVLRVAVLAQYLLLCVCPSPGLVVGRYAIGGLSAVCWTGKIIPSLPSRKISLRYVCTKSGKLVLRKIIRCHQMSYLKAKIHEIQFRLGLHPTSRWWNLQHSPIPPSWI